MEGERRRHIGQIINNKQILMQSGLFDYYTHNLTDYLSRDIAEDEILKLVADYIAENFDDQARGQGDHKWRVYDEDRRCQQYTVHLKNRHTSQYLFHLLDRGTCKRPQHNYLMFRRQQRNQQFYYQRKLRAQIIKIWFFGPDEIKYRKQNEQSLITLKKKIEEEGNKMEQIKKQNPSNYNQGKGNSIEQNLSIIFGSSKSRSHLLNSLLTDIFQVRKLYRGLLDRIIISNKLPILGLLTKLVFCMFSNQDFLKINKASQITESFKGFVDAKILDIELIESLQEKTQNFIMMKIEKQKLQEQIQQQSQDRQNVEKDLQQSRAELETQEDEEYFQVLKAILESMKQIAKIEEDLREFQLWEQENQLMNFTRIRSQIAKYFIKSPPELFRENIEEFAKARSSIRQSTNDFQMKYSTAQEALDKILKEILQVRHKEISYIYDSNTCLEKDENKEIFEILRKEEQDKINKMRRELGSRIRETIQLKGSFKFIFDMTDHLSREINEISILDKIVKYISENYEKESQQRGKHGWRVEKSPRKKQEYTWYVWLKNQSPKTDLLHLLDKRYTYNEQLQKRNYLTFIVSTISNRLKYKDGLSVKITHFGPLSIMERQKKKSLTNRGPKKGKRVKLL